MCIFLIFRHKILCILCICLRVTIIVDVLEQRAHKTHVRPVQFPAGRSASLWRTACSFYDQSHFDTLLLTTVASFIDLFVLCLCAL